MKSAFGIVLTTLSLLGFVHHSISPPIKQAAAAVTAFPQVTIATTSKPTHASIKPPRPITASSKAGKVLGASTSAGTVTQSQLQAAIDQSNNSLRQLIYANAGTIGNGLYSTGGYTNNIAISNAINQLRGVSISGGTIANASVAGLTGLTTSDIGGFSYATNSSFVHIAAWGDSITSGYGGDNASWPTLLSLSTGYSVFNGGKGGDTSTQINARFFAQPDKFSYPTIIWSGRNNYSNPSTVQADLASMVASLTTPNYIVLSILNGAGEGATTTAYSQIISLNAALAATYGSHYLDIRAYLVSQYDPTNPTDVDNFNSDVPPSSLRYDFLHPNTTGYSKVAQYIQAHLSLLGVTSGNALVTTSNLAQFSVSPPTFGFVNSQTGYQQDGTTVLVASSTKFTTYVGLGVGTNDTAKWNTAVGYQSLFSGTTASANDAFGFQSLYYNTTGANNSAYGVYSLYGNTTGSSNIAQGGQSLFNNTTGSNNTSVGFTAMQTNTTGSSNVAVGYRALYYNNSATNTVAIGQDAALGNFSNYSAQGSVAVGWSAGKKFATGSDFNTVLGYSAGGNITTGAGNIWIGAASTTANSNITTGYANTAIGNNIKLPSATASYQLDIGNIIYGINIDGTGTTVSTGNIGVGTTTPWRKFSITGNVGFDGLTGAAGAGSLCLSSNKEVVFNSGSDSCLPSLRSTKHDIAELSISGTSTVAALKSVSFIYNSDASSTVRYGFIAEDAALVNAHLGTYDAQGNISGVDDRSLISVLVKSVQEILAELSSLEAAVTGFANSFHTQQLCVGDGPNDSNPVCITKSQLAAMLAGNSQPSVQINAPTPLAIGTTTPPSINIAGSNPAKISMGDTYIDLGAIVTDNQGHDLSYRTFVNGALSGNILIDTSQVATDTIDYVATDTWGNTATSTRIVIIEPSAPSTSI